MISPPVPASLKNGFMAHFVIDLLFAVPLFLFPQAFLSLFGWQSVDPFATRIAAAALFGIGIESFLGRNASIHTYKNMLNLKIIWSGAAVAGIALSMIQSSYPASFGQWLLLVTFIGFHLLWVYWRLKIRRL